MLFFGLFGYFRWCTLMLASNGFNEEGKARYSESKYPIGWRIDAYYLNEQGLKYSRKARVGLTVWIANQIVLMVWLMARHLQFR
jgi:hypothetical protein